MRESNLNISTYVVRAKVEVMPLSRASNLLVKRVFDIVVSALFLVTLFPLIFVVVGLLIKLTSKGSIIFRQRRNGLNGAEFWCYKFRSMRLNDESDTLPASKDDPRKTKVGDLLRRTNIDELPQFFNVLMGDMSIVGPRPHMLLQTEEYSQLINSYSSRHLVKPGVSGWAQINGLRGEIKNTGDMKARVRADIWYMQHWSFALDTYIIYRTLVNMFCRCDNRAF